MESTIVKARTALHADDSYIKNHVIKMQSWVLVGIGGFIGAVLRYLLSGLIQNNFHTFPVGTLVVNFTGSLILSVIMYLSEYLGFFPADIRVFLTIGVLGAFTTMSTFSYETFKLLELREYLFFIINIVGTITLCIAGIYLGKIIAFKIGGLI